MAVISGTLPIQCKYCLAYFEGRNHSCNDGVWQIDIIDRAAVAIQALKDIMDNHSENDGWTGDIAAKALRKLGEID